MSAAKTIEKVINAPKKAYTTSEAQLILHKYGVLTKKNTITKAYSHVIVKINGRRINGSK